MPAVNWRSASIFLAALGFLLAVILLGWLSVRSVQDRERVIAAAAVERQQLLQGQDDLKAQIQRIVVWLNSQDIVVPEEVLTGRPAPRSNGDDDSDDSDDNDDGDSDEAPAQPTPKPRATKQAKPPSDNDGGDRPRSSDDRGNGQGRDKPDRGNDSGGGKGSNGRSDKGDRASRKDK